MNREFQYFSHMNIKRSFNICVFHEKKITNIMIPFDFTGQQVLFLFDKQKIVHEIRNEGVYTDENQKN